MDKDGNSTEDNTSPENSSTSDVIRFDSASEASEAILEAVESARKSLIIFSHYLDPKLFDSSELHSTISRLARRHKSTEIKILLRDTKPLHQRTHKIVYLCQRLSSHLTLRKLNEDWSDPYCGFVAVDKTHLVFFNNEANYQGFTRKEAKAEVKHQLIEFDHAWNHYSEEDINLRQFII